MTAAAAAAVDQEEIVAMLPVCLVEDAAEVCATSEGTKTLGCRRFHLGRPSGPPAATSVRALAQILPKRFTRAATSVHRAFEKLTRTGTHSPVLNYTQLYPTVHGIR